jgi:hypothetical protein
MIENLLVHTKNPQDARSYTTIRYIYKINKEYVKSTTDTQSLSQWLQRKLIGLSMTLRKHVQDPCTENYKMLMKEIKEIQRNREAHSVHGSQD